MHLICEETFTETQGHKSLYLKLFQPTVFFFNLPSFPHLVAQITEELTKSIVPPASSLGISSFI